MEFGLTTFAEVAADPTRRAQDEARRLDETMAEVILAETTGLDVFGVGEHHRDDFVVSAPAVVLAAMAAVTERIRLASAVTVLSSDDPVRVFQQFATVDLLSHGRAEIWAGRGSFTESFPLFGLDLQDYDSLYAEKIELLLALRDEGPVSWSGRHRAPLEDVVVYPRSLQTPLPVWLAVGGTPNSVVRAAELGLPLVVAIIGGMPESFGPLVELYRRGLRAAGRDTAAHPVAINQHTFVGEDSQRARDTFYPSYASMMDRIGRDRGWQPMTRMQFDALCGPRGALLVGDPDEVAAKILAQHRIFGHDRHLAHTAVGPLDHADVLRSIELFGTEVAPRVREGLAAG